MIELFSPPPASAMRLIPSINQEIPTSFFQNSMNKPFLSEQKEKEDQNHNLPFSTHNHKSSSFSASSTSSTSKVILSEVSNGLEASLHSNLVKTSPRKSKLCKESEKEKDNRKHVRVNVDQLVGLTEAYDQDSMPSRESNHDLAKRLGMSYRRVQVWFQNRRAKERRTKASTRSSSNEDLANTLHSDNSTDFASSALNSLSQIAKEEQDEMEREKEKEHNSSCTDDDELPTSQSSTHVEEESASLKKGRVDFLIS